MFYFLVKKIHPIAQKKKKRKKEYFIAMFPFFFWIFGAKFQEKKLLPFGFYFWFCSNF
jgi:hypothetical protein